MIQVIKYKCCGKIFAASTEPYCYTDNDWLRNLKKYVIEGHKVEMVKNGDWSFEECTCNKKQINLFES